MLDIVNTGLTSTPKVRRRHIEETDGRFLALRGRTLVILDASAAASGLVNKFFDETMPKYFKGPVRPRLGDLVRKSPTPLRQTTVRSG